MIQHMKLTSGQRVRSMKPSVIKTSIFCGFIFYRLQYFARGLQVYIRQLRVALQGKTGDALKTEEVIVSHFV